LPSGENSRQVRPFCTPLRVYNSLPSGRLHSLISPSVPSLVQLPLASSLPPAANVTAITGPPCPLSVRSSCPVRACHSLTVLSLPPVASRLPSGAKATQLT